MSAAIDDTHAGSKTSVLDLKFISHGTLETKDPDLSRKFYEEFMGFEVIRASSMSLMIRLGGGPHIYVVVPKMKDGPPMAVTNHNGVDVYSDADVDRSYEMVKRDAEKWGLHRISKPTVQHGTYSFYFWDRDDNSWEILSNPQGGYSWMFERDDQDGKGSYSKEFQRPTAVAAKTA
jgi:catechol 2,3-dioxygenase-like lactoylglutathione lyase family enzyme